jgi:hypothetical protein
MPELSEVAAGRLVPLLLGIYFSAALYIHASFGCPADAGDRFVALTNRAPLPPMPEQERLAPGAEFAFGKGELREAQSKQRTLRGTKRAGISRPGVRGNECYLLANSC